MPRRKRPVLGVDYIIDPDGSAQFTRDFLLKRGDCCEHNCRYCPFHAAGSACMPVAHAPESPGSAVLAVIER